MASSLVTRLAGTYALVTGIVLVLFGAVTYSGLSNVLTQQLDNGLLATARSEAAYATDHDRHARHGVHLHDNADLANPNGLHHHVQITDLSGRVIAATHNLNGHTLPLDPLALRSNAAGTPVFRSLHLMGLPHRMLYYPLTHDGFRYSLQVAVSREYLDGVEDQLLRLFAGISLLALGVTVTLGYLLAKRAVAPLRHLTVTAEAIHETNLGARMPESTSHDEIGQLTQVLNRMLDRLEQAFDTQNRFVSDAAHELRSPLTILKASVDLALRRERSTLEYQQFLSSNAEEIDRLITLTNDLLMLAENADGTLQLRLTPVALSSLVTETIGRHRATAADKGVALTMALPDQEVMVMGDRDRLTQLLDNLISNALRYTPAGKGVTVETQRDPARALIIVSDEGIGIPLEDQSRIFQRFYRTDQARTREAGGTGLGLSISQLIAVQHGGGIRVQSRLGIGSQFTVLLPLGDAPTGNETALC